MNGKSTGNLRDMFEQHIPLTKPFTHRHFKRFTGYVSGKGESQPKSGNVSQTDVPSLLYEFKG